MNLVFVAMPAAGKGTIGKILNSLYGYKIISTGDILRKESEKNNYIKDTIAKGNFVNEDLIIKLVKKEILNLGDNLYILDGFPRTLNQAQAYLDMLDEINGNDFAVINFEVSKEIVVKRIMGRRICFSCGAIYNVNFKEASSKKDGICDFCNSPLSLREDDNLESIEKRLSEYYEKTLPLIDFFENINKIYTVDANKNIEYTLSQIKSIIEMEDVK